MASLRTRWSKSCRVQGCFPVIFLPCLPNMSAFWIWPEPRSPESSAAARPAPGAKATMGSSNSRSANTLGGLGGIFDRVGRRGLLLDIPPSSDESKTEWTKKQTWPYLRPHFPKAPKPASKKSLQLRTSKSPLRLSPQWPTTSKTSKQQHPRRACLASSTGSAVCAEAACISNPSSSSKFVWSSQAPPHRKDKNHLSKRHRKAPHPLACFAKPAARGTFFKNASVSLHGARLIEACCGLQEPHRTAKPLPARTGSLKVPRPSLLLRHPFLRGPPNMD